MQAFVHTSGHPSMAMIGLPERAVLPSFFILPPTTSQQFQVRLIVWRGRWPFLLHLGHRRRSSQAVSFFIIARCNSIKVLLYFYCPYDDGQ